MILINGICIDQTQLQIHRENILFLYFFSFCFFSCLLFSVSVLCLVVKFCTLICLKFCYICFRYVIRVLWVYDSSQLFHDWGRSIDLLCESMDWFLYDNGLRHEIIDLTVPEFFYFSRRVIILQNIRHIF